MATQGKPMEVFAREHRAGDQAFSADDIGDRPGERRRQRDCRGARGHQRADFAGADMKFARQFWQQRLRRIEIDESGKARSGHREAS